MSEDYTLKDIIIRLDKQDARLAGIDARLANLEQRTAKLEAAVGEVRQEQRIQGAKLDALQTSVYWGFGIIAFVCAYVSIPRRSRKEEKDAATLPQVVVYASPAQAQVKSGSDNDA